AGMVPLNCDAGRIPNKLTALSAATAYGDDVRFCTGVSAADPFTPSLNHIRNCKFGCANSAAAIEVILGALASPKTTVNRQLLAPTFTAPAGSLPATLEPSLLQKVV